MRHGLTSADRLGILILLLSAAGCGEVETTLRSTVSPELARLESERESLLAGLESLGTGAIGQTTPEFGAQHIMLVAPPPESPWVQIDLGESRSFDSVTLVPVILKFDAPGSDAYAFPRRFRVDASDDADFADFQPLFETGDTDFETAGGLPVVIETPDTEARYLRVTVNRLSEVAERWTFALAEIIVLQGNRNLALNAAISMRGATKLAPRWQAEYLVDGRTPLGPPVLGGDSRTSLPEYDGVFNGVTAKGDPNWMQVDLGEPRRVDEVRLHPVHARQGADVPGYAFPLRFRIEAALTPDFDDPTTIYDTAGEDFSNPGNNPVTFPAGGGEARYVRVVCLQASTSHSQKFGFSEMQVYAGQENVALGKPVIMPNVLDGRPPELLVDGDASFGEILELPEWIDAWRTKRTLTQQLTETERRLGEASNRAKQRLSWLGAAFSGLALIGGVAVVTSRSRQQRREQQAFRERLARDLHDEIGSNLAAIARVGEVAEAEAPGGQAKADWKSVRELALECVESMRSTLWLLGVQRGSGGWSPEELQRIAERMLPKVDVAWRLPDGEWLDAGNEELLRELVLVFKEVLANIARHAQAERVVIEVKEHRGGTSLAITDSGRGFDVGAPPAGGLGLSSMRQRMKKIGGGLSISSTPGRGTTVTLTLPT